MSRGSKYNLVGLRFGKLVVISESSQRDRGHVAWNSRCDCGKVVIVRSGHLIGGNVKSCGCLRHRFIDMTGKRFGKLVVVSEAGRRRKGVTWLCRCDCGNVTVTDGISLRRGHTQSCGCLHREKTFRHGDSNGGHPLYEVWHGMKQRCFNSNDKHYKDYGGRGITVCLEWKSSSLDAYKAFKDWALRTGYKKGLSLDRIDNDGDYSPSNCRWATSYEQVHNRRTVAKLESRIKELERQLEAV